MAQTFAVPLNTSSSIAASVSDASTALDTLRSSFAGTSAPTSPAPVAGQLWWDSTNGTLKRFDGTQWAPVAGIVGTATTPVGNVGASEVTLQSVTVPAGIVKATGQALVIDALVTFAATANAKTAKLRLDGTDLATLTNVGANAETMRIRATVVRTGATAQVCIVETIKSDGTAVSTIAKVAATETWANALVIDTRGTCSTNAEVTGELLLVSVAM